MYVGEHCFFSGLFDKPLQGKVGVVVNIKKFSIEVKPLRPIAGIDVASGSKNNFIFEDEKQSMTFDLSELSRLNNSNSFSIDEEIEFLMERVKQVSAEIGDFDKARAWSGHVVPSIERVERYFEEIGK